MVNRACDPVKPSLVKSLQKNRDKVDDAYQELFYDFRVYNENLNDQTLFVKIHFNRVIFQAD